MADISQIALPDSSSSNIKALKLSYGECSTAAATTAKTVTIISDGAASGSNAPFVLEKGAVVLVKFTTTNTGAVANLTLNVNSTGAKSIKYRGASLPSAGTLAANRIYQFLYDGTNWQLVGDLDTDTNTAVTQTISSTSNADYRVLFSATADDTTRTETTRKDTDFKYNPSTNNLTVGKITLGAAPVNDLEASTKKYVDDSINGLPSPMVFRGSLGTGGTITALPIDGTATVGDTYKVITAGTYASQAAKIGDMFICDSKTSTANTWTYIPSADDVDTIPSAYCDTAGNVEYKFAQCTDYTLLSKSYIQLILKNANTSTSKLYLAIGSNGLQSYKPVYINGSVSSSSNYTLPAGTYLVYYDGTNYYFRTDGKITSPGIVDINGNTTKFLRGDGTWKSPQDIYVDGASFTDNTSTDTNNPVKLTLTREGTTTTVTGTIPKISSSSAGVAPKGAAVSSQSQSTKFLREDGTWAAPSYTTNSDTKVTDTVGTANTLYPAGTTSTSTTTGTQVFDTAMKFTGTTGTTSAIGTAKLTLGNSTASGTANNKQGSLEIYGSTKYAHTLSGAPTANRTLTLPDKTGTIAVTTDTMTPASHTHGNIQNEGTLQTTDVTIASGDKLVVTDSSDSNKVARTSVSFDGSTTTKCLTQKGTWASFTNNSGTVTGTGTSGYLTKWNSSSGITNGPQLSSSISSQTQSTKFLREDGTWSAPSYTTNTDTVPCAYCDTAAGTAAKTATCTDYTLTSNTYLHVLIKNANTKAGALTLSVNGQTAKTIYINGTTTSSSNYTLPAGTYIVYYDGTNYHFRTDGRIPGEANAAYRLNLQVADSYNANYPIAFGTAASGQALVGTDSGFTFNPTGNKIRGLNMITSTNSGSDEFSIGGGGGGLTISSTTTSLLPAKDLQILATAGSISIMGKTWSGGTGTTAVVNTSGYLIKNTSSIRYKDNVDYEINRQDYHNQLMQLKPCTFEYKVQPGETQLGLIAEDVAEINPDIPNYDSEGLPESLKDRDLTTLLIIEAQEKDKIIQSLQSEIELLKQRLDNLES